MKLRAAAGVIGLWAAVAAAAVPAGEHILKTKDGRQLIGVVLAETQQGYLFKTATGTELVPFGNIEDLQPVAAPDVAPPPPPPPYAEPLAPPAPAPAPAPREVEPEEPAPLDWRAERKGFHWSLGLGGMVDPGLSTTASGALTAGPVAGFVAAVPAISWGMGWVDLHLELQPLGYFKGAVKAFFLGFNPQARINFARFYSLGVGTYLGVVFSPSVDFCAGLSFSPAIIKLGPRGQHEIALWAGSPLLATSAALANVLLLLLSYSYVF